MSTAEFLNSLILPTDCPDKIKKIIYECSNPNEILDSILKLLGDTSNESHLDGILEIIPQICSDSTIQPSEIEFAILSFQNIYNMNLFKTDIKCKLLQVIVTVLMLIHQPSQEVTEDVVQFFSSILENKSEPIFSCHTSLDCLLEIELSMPGILKPSIQLFFVLLQHESLQNKASEITSVILKNGTNLMPNDSTQILHVLLDMLPSLNPFTMVMVAKNILPLCGNTDFQMGLENSLKKLGDRYKNTFDLCILQTITSIQERLNGITDENAVFLCCTLPSLSVGRNLIALDWLSSSHLKNDSLNISRFEPTYFDGADARLKKMTFLNKILLSQSLDSTLLSYHFEQLVAFAVKTASSRAFAAVFRVLRNMVESKFPTNAEQIVVLNVVNLGARIIACLPHIVDFLKYLGTNQSSEAITLGLIDSYDEMEVNLMVPHIEHLIKFFTESTSYSYEFCQPRMVLHIIRNCLEDKNCTKTSTFGVSILELCQALIRNQDYEIFQPELKTVLSLIETSHRETDVKQRAWMLRSLITHVNTDSLKDAFDDDMDLSSTGKIENVDHALVIMNILFDYKLTDISVSWSFERKRCRSFYFPLEIFLDQSQKSFYREFFGIQIDFMVDSKWGRVESIYIPVLEFGQVKKACMQLQPIICSAATIEARVTMSTTDGRIFLSNLKPIEIKLEHLLSPLSSSKSFCELWDRLTSQCDKCYSSSMFLPQYEKLLKAVEYGELDRFQMGKKPTELAMVTPNSCLVLVRILSVKNSWHAEILVEDPSVLPVIYSLLTEYSTT